MPTAIRGLETGMILKGTVASLTDFGAFIDVPTEDGDTITGLCHVSNVADGFVDNIYAWLAVGDEVEVKVVEVRADGKVALSIADAPNEDTDVPTEEDGAPVSLKPRTGKDFNRKLRRFLHKSQAIQGFARRQRKGRLGIE